MKSREERTQANSLQVGVGLRPPHYAEVLEELPPVSWFEVVTENFLGLDGCGGGPRQLLERVRSHYPLGLHGTGLSIGSTDPLDRNYLSHLKTFVDQIQPEWVTDHLCWTSVGGEHLHDLLPLPYDEASLTHVVNRVDAVQHFLGREIGLENVSSYISFRQSELSEAQFLSEVARRTGCGILLDVNNIFVSCTNHGWSGDEYLAGIEMQSLWYVHLAGHSQGKHGLVDTHDAPVPPPVWDIYRRVLEKTGPIPGLVERDGNIPAFETLWAEAKRAQQIQEEVCGQINAQGAARTISPPPSGKEQSLGSPSSSV